MILLDTNVLSEFMRPLPDPAVVRWLDGQAGDRVWTSSVSRAEIELGLALLPDGRRKRSLAAAAGAMFEEDFAGRSLPFDDGAATRYAEIVATRSRSGRPVSIEDAQIAAIALSHGLVLATRNERDFVGIDSLVVVNPWRHEPETGG